MYVYASFMQIFYYENRSICNFFIFQKRLTFSHNISCCWIFVKSESWVQWPFLCSNQFSKIKTVLIETIVALFSKMQIFVHSSDDF